MESFSDVLIIPVAEERKKEEVIYPPSDDCFLMKTSEGVRRYLDRNWEKCELNEVKRAFVKMIPDLAPVETLEIEKHLSPAGYNISFKNRPYKSIIISPDKMSVCLLEMNAEIDAEVKITFK